MASETMSKFKKFLASGKKPSFEPGKGARPEGSPKATVFKSKTKKTTKKPVANKKLNLLEKIKENKERKKANTTRREMLYSKRNLSKEDFLKVRNREILRLAEKTLKESKSRNKTSTKTKTKTPKTKGNYPIAKGDTLSSISKKFKMPIADIMAKNPQIKDPNRIRAGSGLNIPSFKSSVNLADSYGKQKGYKTGGMTKRSFGGMAIKGVKDPSKIFKG